MLIISKELRDELVKRERSFVLILPKVLNPLSQSAECMGITSNEQLILPKFGYMERCETRKARKSLVSLQLRTTESESTSFHSDKVSATSQP